MTNTDVFDSRADSIHVAANVCAVHGHTIVFIKQKGHWWEGSFNVPICVKCGLDAQEIHSGEKFE